MEFFLTIEIFEKLSQNYIHYFSQNNVIYSKELVYFKFKRKRKRNFVCFYVKWTISESIGYSAVIGGSNVIFVNICEYNETTY